MLRTTRRFQIYPLFVWNFVWRQNWSTPICATRLRWINAWWRHQIETFSTLLAICAGYSPVTGEVPTQRPVTWSFDVFFDMCLNKRLSKQWWGWWFETPSRLLWRHCNVNQGHWYLALPNNERIMNGDACPSACFCLYRAVFFSVHC